ncbi:hypothetical protein OGAPHI_000760 [Ogataea philodendri]|uniref:Protein EFR3 n=1 Tax=Ogataea philodendri TaxID=1378263 RepID=A0A9P8PGJ9_9ASCO|nr:uncharacterized protein OGAPHI_000760 [Ogataea philodendri]KAH3671049.1 hypothetical protein OGAPHI_000760 [Ogataea philodendri]
MPLLPNFRPKHQRLILQCYPSKKLSLNETKPNNAELSYLLYYASTRRTKLEKVGNFLLKKTKLDVSHSRIGHIKVTLFILQELITKCSDDLGILSSYIIDILTLVVQLKELSSTQLGLTIFAHFCDKIQQNQKQILSSSSELLRHFLNLASTYLNLGANTSDANWSKVSLEATHSVSKYLDPNISNFGNAKLIEKSIFLILDKADKNDNSLTLIKTLTGPDVHAQNASIEQLAIYSLKLFFDTNAKKQVDLTTKALVKYVVTHSVEISWFNRLIEACAKKTHIDLRYRIVSMFILELNASKDPESRETIAYLISNLLSSEDVNMVGLPVKEILSDVVRFQKESVFAKDASSLNNGYIEIVRSLGTHIYYNDQINDMIQEVLSIYYQSVNSTDLFTRSSEFVEFSDLIISDVEGIFQSTHGDSLIDYKRAPYRVNIFNYLYYTLDFKNVASFVSPQDKALVQEKWFQLVESFYSLEADRKLFSKPNHESCITNKTEQSTLLLFSLIETVSSNETASLNVAIAKLLAQMVDTMRVNFVVTYVSYTSRWFASPEDYKFSLNWLVLQQIAQTYSLKELATVASGKIAALQAAGLWYEPFGQQTSADASASTEKDYGLSSRETIDLLSTDQELKTWLSAAGYEESSPGKPPVVIRSSPKIFLGHSTTATDSLLNHSSSSIVLPFESSPRSANGSINNVSLLNYSTARSIASSRVHSNSTHLRDLRSIVSGNSTGPSTKDSLSKLAATNSSQKKSGLAYCITDLDLSDDSDIEYNDAQTEQIDQVDHKLLAT